MAELLNCPFCGGGASLALCGFGTARVTCMECGSEGQYCPSREEAIAAWNRRAPSSPSIEREAKAPSIEVPPGMSRIDAFFWLEHRAGVVEALAQKGLRVVSNADRVWLAPIKREVSGEGWVSMAERRPERGQLIVKRWKSNGAVWAGVYAATDKDSSFDEWVALPPCVTPCDGGKSG